MKRMISLIAVVFFTIIATSTADESYIKKLNSEFKGKDGVTYLNVTKAIMNSFTKGKTETEQGKKLAQIISNIEGVLVLNVDVKKAEVSKGKVDAIIKHLNSNYKDYEVLMEMNFEGQVFKLLSNKETKDHMLFKIDKDNILIANLRGEVNLLELMQAGAMMGMNIETMVQEHIKKEKAKAGE